jgi:hypothetical protein
MKKNLWYLGVVAILLVSITGCSSQNPTEPDQVILTASEAQQTKQGVLMEILFTGTDYEATVGYVEPYRIARIHVEKNYGPLNQRVVEVNVRSIIDETPSSAPGLVSESSGYWWPYWSGTLKLGFNTDGHVVYVVQENIEPGVYPPQADPRPTILGFDIASKHQGGVLRTKYPFDPKTLPKKRKRVK